MQKFLLIAILVGVAYADDDAHAHIAKDYRKEDGHGHFEYGYDLTNGIGADESGDEHAVHGEYHFTSKDGVPVKVSYTADEHGYHPHSDLLPTPPPTPAAILKALKYIESHPNQHHQDGHYHAGAEHAHHVDEHHVTHHETHQNARKVHHNAHNAHRDTHHGAHNAHHNVHKPNRGSHHNTHHHGSHH